MCSLTKAGLFRLDTVGDLKDRAKIMLILRPCIAFASPATRHRFCVK